MGGGGVALFSQGVEMEERVFVPFGMSGLGDGQPEGDGEGEPEGEGEGQPEGEGEGHNH